MTPRYHHRHSGFTLVEMLTVVAIIALLISILVPSLARARDQAKRATIKALIKAASDGLDMFYNDFNQYPDSSLRPDPVQGYPGAGTNNNLSGAHWLARALLGHDFEGMDIPGAVVGSVPINYDLVSSDRRGVYLERGPWAKDNDSQKILGQTGTPDTGRPVIVDTYNFPILYYRANARAARPFSNNAIPGDPQSEALGIYNHRDNVELMAWEFAPGAPAHLIAEFGPTDYETDSSPDNIKDPKGNFVHYLHDHAIHEATNAGNGGRIRTVNPESLILISSGKDGVYGTDDDLTNFKGGL